MARLRMEVSNGLLSNSGKRVMISICMKYKYFTNKAVTKIFVGFCMNNPNHKKKSILELNKRDRIRFKISNCLPEGGMPERNV